MKKIISVILSIALLLGMSATAFADGYYSYGSSQPKTYEHGLYDYDQGWWYDYNGIDDYYYFDNDELTEIEYAFAETFSKAEGIAALYHLIEKLQENNLSLMNYTVVKQKTANHVYFIEVMDQRGYVWTCYYATYTHDSAKKVMDALMNGKKIKYYSIFLTTYVEGQKIKNYDSQMEMITGFDQLTDAAISEFVYKMRNFDYWYDYYYNSGWNFPVDNPEDGLG